MSGIIRTLCSRSSALNHTQRSKGYDVVNMVAAHQRSVVAIAVAMRIRLRARKSVTSLNFYMRMRGETAVTCI